MIRDELQGNKVYPIQVDPKAKDRVTKRLRFNEDAAAMSQAFERHNAAAHAAGEPLAHDLPIERQREIARGAFDNPVDPHERAGVRLPARTVPAPSA